MKTYRVQFINVGRNHLTWSADVPRPLTQHGLMREIRKHKALMSHDIEFTDDGGIYVGLVRRVGSWLIQEGETAQTEDRR